MNRSTLSLILSFVVSSNSQPEDAGKSAQMKISAEEYAVYSFLLSTEDYDRKPVKLFVIEDMTKTPSTDPDRRAPERLLESRTSTHLMSPDFRSAVEDYKNKNAQAHRLNRSFTMRTSYRLVSRGEFNSLFTRGGPPWEEYYKKYPRSPGYISLSRVGFNSEQTRAIVYREILCHTLCADGSYILFMKENGVWKKKGSISCWVS